MEMHSCKRAKDSVVCLLIVLAGVCGVLGTSPIENDQGGRSVQAHAHAAAMRGHEHVKSSRKLLAIPRSNSTDAQLGQVNPKACPDKGESVKCKMNPCTAVLCSVDLVCEVAACSCKARCKKAVPQAQKPGCADGSNPVQCLVDPCISATCEEGTVCEANYCGGCNHVCKQLPTNDTKTPACSDGSEPVECFVDPCEAQNFCKDGEVCERDYCGGCKEVCKPAQLDEPHPSNTCSDGSSPVQCLVDPCISATCEEGTVCEANYCGGCNPVCKPAQLDEPHPSNTCSDGSNPVQCLVDPCITATCEEGTVCEANYCGGCNHVCKPAQLDEPHPSNTCSDGSHPVQCLVDPCITATCEKGTVCEADYCSGCNHVCKPAQLDKPHPGSTCSDGSHPVQCLVDPCITARCKEGTVCTSDYCGGCKAVCIAQDSHAPK